MEVTAKKLPADIYKCRIKTLNILFSVLNVAMPAIVWILVALGEDKALAIAFAIMQSLIAISFVVLIWGIIRMVRLVGSLNDIIANKVTITIHILSYLFIIVTNV
jgi:hypothetical protein